MKITRVFILTLSMLAAIGAQAGLDSRSFMQRFAEIEQYASHQDALAAVDSLMTEVQLQNSKEFTYLRAIDVAEEHLCNAVDSLFDIDLYAQVLHHATTSGALSGDVLVRPQIMLEMLSKNRVGTQAADILLATADTTFNLVDVATPFTLIYFYDPSCDACAELKHRLDTCSTLRNAAQARKITVIAIQPLEGADAQLAPMPDYILNAIDSTNAISLEETYSIQNLPSFYLLAPDKTVILQEETSLNRTLAAIETLLKHSSDDIDQLINLAFSSKR